MHEHQTDSEFVCKEPCPKCGSRDNLARYTDGHGFCFGCEHYEPADGERPITQRRKPMPADLIEFTEYKALNARKITEETCRHFGYFIAQRREGTVHVAPYRDADGNVVAQHLRTKDKDFPWLGEPKHAVMFGQHLWRDGGKMVVVTEGEIDAMSVSQMQGNKWPVVSVACGAAMPDEQGRCPKVSNYIAKHVSWLEKFEKVVFMFDMDEQGVASAKAAASVLSPGRAFIASLPLHDANDLLKEGRGKEIIDAIWGAKSFRPDGLVFFGDLVERIKTSPQLGLPWCLPTLTKATYGRRWGQCVALGAGTGIGKTDFVTQQIEFDVMTLHEKVGLIYLEQPVEETGKRLAGKYAGKRFHVPAADAGWTQDELDKAVAALAFENRIAMYDHFGQCDWDFIKAHIRYLNKAHGVRIFYLDHLTALAAGAEEGEKDALERIMAELSGLCQELGIWMLFISHLTTPSDGKSHEEGGRVTIRQFKGSRSIGFWSHFMFGMERDQQHADPVIAGITTFRVLKDRYTGNSTGLVFYLGYDKETGRLFETEMPVKSSFKDETTDEL